MNREISLAAFAYFHELEREHELREEINHIQHNIDQPESPVLESAGITEQFEREYYEHVIRNRPPTALPINQVPTLSHKLRLPAI